MDWVGIVSTVGFPIAAFLLIYLDLRRLINENTRATNELSQNINNLLTRFK